MFRRDHRVTGRTQPPDTINNASPSNQLSRREFLNQTAAGVAAATVAGAALGSSIGHAAESSANMIGIQIGSISFVDEGVEQVLELLQERGAVNTVFLTTFTYGRGLGGRQVPGQPFPDHGKQESDERIFHGGNYAAPHPEFYQKTPLKQTRAPDHGDLDIVAAVLPAASQRGTLCLFHPGVRAFWTGLAADLCTSYDIDGILFFNERNGPLLNALGASHAQSIASSRVTCFCEFHQKAASERGISFDRAREGYRKLDQFVQNALADKRPGDGYFVEFWRLLVEYPEIMLWDRLFDEGKHQVLAEVNAAVKSVRKDLQVGFHIEHVNSFNPIFRATRRYDDLAQKADFLKVVVYNNCGGERYAHFIQNVGSTVFRDVPKDELLRLNNHLLNYETEAALDALPTAGLSPDYVARETKRALAGVQGKCKIYPGIDIGIPTGRNSRKASAADTYATTFAALKAGAQGVMLSRKYSEMRLANLEAAGRAAREVSKQ